MKSFEEYIKPLDQKIYRLCLAYTSNPHDAEDVKQESMIRAFKAFKNFNHDSSFDTWMYRITVNCCLSWIKNAKKQENNLETTADSENLHDDKHQQVQIDELRECIGQLKEVDRLIIGLSLEGYKHEEIAKVLDMNHSAVSVRIHRIKNALKHFMEQ